MKLHQALHLTTDMTVAIIGAGGKTTALWRLAEERRESGVLVTTSTHIMQPTECDVCCAPDDLDELRQMLAPGRITCAAYPAAESGKCTGLSPALFAAARADGIPILYEADGSKKLPAKLHQDGEPVIYPQTDAVLLLAGLRALGQPVGQVCHRFEQSPRMRADPMRPFDPQDLLETIRDGIRASGVPQKRLRILINQADTPARFADALPVAQILRQEGFCVRVGCLRNLFWP